MYEEEYLVASVGRLIERVNGLHEEVGRLVMGLLRRGMREQARLVEQGMREVSEACGRARVEVWEAVKVELEGQGAGLNTYDVDGVGRPPGADGVFWDSQQESAKQRAPEVKVWRACELIP